MIDDDPLLVTWTIYDHPTDFPDCYVALKWLVKKSGAVLTGEALASADISDLRRELYRRGLIRVLRHPKADPNIVETWL